MVLLGPNITSTNIERNNCTNNAKNKEFGDSLETVKTMTDPRCFIKNKNVLTNHKCFAEILTNAFLLQKLGFRYADLFAT